MVRPTRSTHTSWGCTHALIPKPWSSRDGQLVKATQAREGWGMVDGPAVDGDGFGLDRSRSPAPASRRGRCILGCLAPGRQRTLVQRCVGRVRARGLSSHYCEVASLQASDPELTRGYLVVTGHWTWPLPAGVGTPSKYRWARPSACPRFHCHPEKHGGRDADRRDRSPIPACGLKSGKPLE